MDKKDKIKKTSGKRFLVELLLYSILWFSIPLSKNYEYLFLLLILIPLMQLFVNKDNVDWNSNIAKTTKEKIFIAGLILFLILPVILKSFTDTNPIPDEISNFFDDPHILYKFYIPVWVLAVFYMYYRWHQENEDTLNKDISDFERYKNEDIDTK